MVPPLTPLPLEILTDISFTFPELAGAVIVTVALLLETDQPLGNALAIDALIVSACVLAVFELLNDVLPTLQPAPLIENVAPKFTVEDDELTVFDVV